MFTQRPRARHVPGGWSVRETGEVDCVVGTRGGPAEREDVTFEAYLGQSSNTRAGSHLRECRACDSARRRLQPIRRGPITAKLMPATSSVSVVRWSDAKSAKAAATRQVDQIFAGFDVANRADIEKSVAKSMSGRLKTVGLSKKNGAIIEASFERFLTLLNAHLDLFFTFRSCCFLVIASARRYCHFGDSAVLEL